MKPKSTTPVSPRSATPRSVVGFALLGALAGGLFLWWRGSRPAPPIARSTLALPSKASAAPTLARVAQPGGVEPRGVEPAPAPAEASLDRAAFNRAISAPPRFAPRDPAEWQGMRPDLSINPPCETSAGCPLARACLRGACGPCSKDADCGPKEACVLNNCIQASAAACRSYKDCAKGELCILTGYSEDPRGNAGTLAKCSGLPNGPKPPLPPAPTEDTRTEPLPNADLMAEAQKLLKGP